MDSATKAAKGAFTIGREEIYPRSQGHQCLARGLGKPLKDLQSSTPGTTASPMRFFPSADFSG